MILGSRALWLNDKAFSRVDDVGYRFYVWDLYCTGFLVFYWMLGVPIFQMLGFCMDYFWDL